MFARRSSAASFPHRCSASPIAQLQGQGRADEQQDTGSSHQQPQHVSPSQSFGPFGMSHRASFPNSAWDRKTSFAFMLVRILWHCADERLRVSPSSRNPSGFPWQQSVGNAPLQAALKVRARISALCARPSQHECSLFVLPTLPIRGVPQDGLADSGQHGRRRSKQEASTAPTPWPQPPEVVTVLSRVSHAK